ncbi:uncharacterized protein A1O5_03227 [Cladophialophora psammophila CBS 110553]|uniref:Uncharacterized protein n=1 Tax=Cladophialophora psammophila CBS 110553 TaxID=1182543 RepID=W9X966_9EURO|nr:uncharacterized protein A1O5_03227 [Cladophialophora psammophila CBS 110553]EXJ73466.1 hypothetical protein A1O5_03227 [Cladophialophora psammophila CBS 110553]
MRLARVAISAALAGSSVLGTADLSSGFVAVSAKDRTVANSSLMRLEPKSTHNLPAIHPSAVLVLRQITWPGDLGRSLATQSPFSNLKPIRLETGHF